jgi:hypothetical protein
MRNPRRRRAMALVAVLAVLSLLAILAVATLSVTSRLGQGSALAVRDGRLDGNLSYAIATVLLEWRQRGLSTVPIGTTRESAVVIHGTGDTVAITVSRLSADLFWIVAQATAIDGALRRSNMVARLPLPRTDSIPAITAGGDVTLSRWLTVVPDSGPGCVSSAPDIRLGTHATLTPSSGDLPLLRVEREAIIDSTGLRALSGLSVTELTKAADLIVPSGASMPAPNGVVRARGDLTLTGGSGGGVLVVDGRLTLTGPVSFTGVIIASGGFIAAAPGSELRGLLRTGPTAAGESGIDISHSFTLRPSACASQAALASAIVARPVFGRSWAEMY